MDDFVTVRLNSVIPPFFTVITVILRLDRWMSPLQNGERCETVKRASNQPNNGGNLNFKCLRYIYNGAVNHSGVVKIFTFRCMDKL